MNDQPKTVISVNSQTYNEHDIFNLAFRQGCDGIGYHPPHQWGNEIKGNAEIAQKIYSEGYRAGRLEWRSKMGYFPSSGYTVFDKSILLEIKNGPKL